MSDWFDAGGNGSPVDAGSILDSKVPELVARIITAGALVSFGTTSDGGALSCTVTLDGRWRRAYFRATEEALDWLTAAAEAVEADQPPASPGGRKRQRRPRPG